MRPGSISPPRWLFSILDEALPGQARARALVRDFWRCRRAYQRGFAQRLVAVAKGKRGDDWEVRCLAAVLLQHHFLCLPSEEIVEHSHLLQELGIKSNNLVRGPVDDLVLKDGYSTTKLIPFVREFQRRLARRAWLHDDLRRERPSEGAWATLFLLCREECTIELGRYVFTPHDVIERVLTALRASKGSNVPPQNSLVLAEAEHALARLPAFERAIVEGLVERGAVYWAGAATSTRVNALVCRPAGTVVVIIKPPGSQLEIEIKRAGRGADLPLGVVYERSGQPVPRTHRLDGGSMTLSLRFEAAAAALFSTVFRAVWARPAPVPTTISTRFVDTLPVGPGADHILDYFSADGILNTHDGTMRSALSQSVLAFENEGCTGLPELEGERGVTVRFLHYTAPGQSLMINTSMFRLETVERVLGESAAEWHAERAPGTSWGIEDRRLTDSIMETILGVFHRPRGEYSGRREYIEFAFALLQNRRRADRIFRSLMRQIGTFWGALLALRGHSSGESVVARNVGFATGWHKGRWRVSLAFMDHDNLQFPSPDRHHFMPHQVLAGTIGDESFAIGGPERPRYSDSLAEFLRTIYRVSPEVAAEGKSSLRQGLSRAYLRTGRAIRRDPALRDLFSSEFLNRSALWDRMVAAYLDEGQIEGPCEDGPESSHCFPEEVIAEYKDSIVRYRDLIVRVFGFMKST